MKILDSIKAFNKNKPEVSFFIKLTLFYCVFYYGTLFWIGLCAPGNLYSPFAESYLNYVKWLRDSLIQAAAFFANLLGYNAIVSNTFRVNVVNGFGVNIVYQCVGYGIMSVWAAFALAFPANTKKKVKWLIGGLFAIWFINVIRILALLIAVNQGKNVDINKFGEHHDIFNAFAYGLIVLMIYFYTKSSSKKPQKTKQ